MLTHSPNVNYFHKVFINFLVLKVLVLNIAFLVFWLVLCKQIIRKCIAPTVTALKNGCKYRNIQDLVKSNKTIIHSRLVIAIDVRSASLVLRTLKYKKSKKLSKGLPFRKFWNYWKPEYIADSYFEENDFFVALIETNFCSLIH